MILEWIPIQIDYFVTNLGYPITEFGFSRYRLSLSFGRCESMLQVQ